MGLRRRKFLLGPLILFCLVWVGCAHPPQRSPEPLEGFFEKVTALVTTSVRSFLRGDLSKQRALEEELPVFEKMPNLNKLISEMKRVTALKDLGYLIETDILFELQKPEHDRERSQFDSPEIQRQLIRSIIAGLKGALEQLQERRDAN